MYQSYGFVEVIGYTAAVACLDVMIKSAYVTCEQVEKTGSGYITIAVKGDLASVQAALESAEETAAVYGELIRTKVIARPYDGTLSVMAQKGKEEGGFSG
ncbi:BMC domain-containing protein [Evansella clarkii]|jgi:ethanolamine utilization protein EutM|uniref:BMC domain-containing protein n=1 Tax=Evansella clarkii TaxID=79879 RepID=UPI000998797A|nr:BMC domain-containing protein [Evansella clarkii]